jgi:CHASE3 domain sensor protein
LVRNNRRADAVAVISAASGKATMDDVRMVVTQILESEDNELIGREAELEKRNRVFTGIIAAVAMAALVLIVLCGEVPRLKGNAPDGVGFQVGAPTLGLSVKGVES